MVSTEELCISSKPKLFACQPINYVFKIRDYRFVLDSTPYFIVQLSLNAFTMKKFDSLCLKDCKTSQVSCAISTLPGFVFNLIKFRPPIAS